MPSFNVILRGTTDSNGCIENYITPPSGLQGKCTVRLASFYVDDTDSYEIKLSWGGSGYSYDTQTTGITESLIVNTSQFSEPPVVFRDIPIGPTPVRIYIYNVATGAALNNTDAVVQMILMAGSKREDDMA